MIAPLLGLSKENLNLDEAFVVYFSVLSLMFDIMAQKHRYKLYTAPYTGSVIAELAFAHCGVKVEKIEIKYSDVAGERSRSFLKVNPLSRLPTVILPNGQVLTESGAIIMYLSEKFPQAGLVNHSPLFYRLLFMLTGELYPTFTFADDPSEWVAVRSAREGYKKNVIKFRKELWLQINKLLSARGPWAMGGKFSALDIFVTIMSRWTPGEDWVHDHCPRVKRISARLKALPRFAEFFPK